MNRKERATNMNAWFVKTAQEVGLSTWKDTYTRSKHGPRYRASNPRYVGRLVRRIGKLLFKIKNA